MVAWSDLERFICIRSVKSQQNFGDPAGLTDVRT